jgi:Na+/H+-dicarboxylate symporter/ABC-type amino acid transport substrate-binding protein
LAELHEQERQRMTLGTKILIGLVAGLLAGIFFGELISWVDIAGDIYVGLLQMTVLPYVTVSLIERIGGLTGDQARTLMGRAGVVMLVLWSIALGTVVIMPLSLPEWNAGTFFSASLVDRPTSFDFLGLYLPVNPFHSLANNVVPAVVLFSILFGIALINVPGKERLLEPLSVVSGALGRISNLVVRLAPWGTFALIAGAAGQLSPGQLARIAGYVSTFTVAVVLLAFIVLPGLVAAVTPISARRIVGGSRDAVLTAFATGKLFAVLPMIMRDAKSILTSHGIPEEKAVAAGDVYVPLGYPFPNAGKILSILFLPFAAWFMGTPLELSQYPMLLSVGLLAFFGSPVAAIPFLLDLFRLPADLMPLFLVAGLWCARVSDVVGAVHLNAFTLICTCWNEGQLRLRPARLVAWAGISLVASAFLLLLNHSVITRTLQGQEAAVDLVTSMDLSDRFVEIETLRTPATNPSSLEEGESVLQRVRRTGELRVGYVPIAPPFSYPNGANEQVGFDIDLIQRLAWDLEVRLILVPTRRSDIQSGFQQDYFDIAVGGIPSTVETFDLYQESRPYLDLHGAILVRDHEARHYRNMSAIRRKAAKDGIRIGHERDGVFIRRGHVLPGVERVEVESLEAFVDGESSADVLLVSAETGAVVTMVRPEYSVVIPDDTNIRIPVVFAVRDAPELKRMVDAWIQIREDDGTVDALYSYWVLGKVGRDHEPQRWSVIRDVLGWTD